MSVFCGRVLAVCEKEMYTRKVYCTAWEYGGRFITSLYFQSFGLLDKKSVKIPGIRDFSWSPTDNVLAYWVAEDKDVPARVTLLEIPR
jgi:uncharacterized protein with WD repeat